jgi:hypothetical protein
MYSYYDSATGGGCNASTISGFDAYRNDYCYLSTTSIPYDYYTSSYKYQYPYALYYDDSDDCNIASPALTITGQKLPTQCLLTDNAKTKISDEFYYQIGFYGNLSSLSYNTSTVNFTEYDSSTKSPSYKATKAPTRMPTLRPTYQAGNPTPMPSVAVTASIKVAQVPI